MKITRTVTTELYLQTCVNCAVEFAVLQQFDDRRRADKQTFYCPNGHAMSYRESEADRLRRERDRAIQEQARLEGEVRAAWATANAQVDQRRKVETELKRVRKRATAALCPCCNRSFSQLARHMKSKHPEVVQLPARKELAG